MPICVVCDDRYYHPSWSAPAEPCACGACWAREDVVTDDDANEVSTLRQQWQQALADADEVDA